MRSYPNFRVSGLAACVLLALLPACSSSPTSVAGTGDSGASSSGGSSGGSSANMQAGISVTVAPGTNTTAQCPLIPQTWAIGGATLAPVANGQSFTISGAFDGTTNPQTGITGTFVLPNGLGNWSQATCAVTFPNSSMGIAAGRVWASLDCPTMVDPSNATQCDGHADFRLENCTD